MIPSHSPVNKILFFIFDASGFFEGELDNEEIAMASSAGGPSIARGTHFRGICPRDESPPYIFDFEFRLCWHTRVYVKSFIEPKCSSELKHYGFKSVHVVDDR
jgi:hypothetical protein